jgi:hypothetical protein
MKLSSIVIMKGLKDMGGWISLRISSQAPDSYIGYPYFSRHSVRVSTLVIQEDPYLVTHEG